jgi:4-amino-4-deoxy-L-arabinose transferase-like glycosyltransferase
MKKLFKRYPDLPVFGGLLLIYFLTRLFNLLILPLFTDESIYIYWAKVIEDTHAQWFISLTDGKPPLLIWLISMLLSIFPTDWYLLAGRLPSVATGAVALIAVYKITGLLFRSIRVSILAALLYIFCPMTLFYDRMALFDSMLNAMLLVSVYFAIRTGRSRQLRDALMWGLFLGLAFLSKPTALVFLPLTVFAAVASLSFKDIRTHFRTLSGLSVLAVGLGFGMNSLQRVSSAYPAMVRKNAQFQQPISELLAHPFLFTMGNFKGFYFWMLDYLTLPFFLFGVIACIYGFTKRFRETLLLFVLLFIPLFLLATVGREVFPRYILIVIPYLLIMTAYLMDQLLHMKGILRYGAYAGIAVILLPMLYFDVLILTDPPRAPLPEADANQYIKLHPAGYGLEEVYSFIREKSSEQKITLVTQGTFGLYPYAFYLEFWGDHRVAILPKWPMDKLDSEILAAREKGPVYIILKEHDEIPEQLPLTEVLRAEKPGGEDPILVTELQPTQ